jgi:PAS domain S-box-containing protein
VRQATGEPKYFISVVEDISERKRAQQALQESQRTLATLIGNLPGLVYRCRNDHDWTTEFVSDGVFPLTGYSPSDLKAGKVHLGQLVHPDDREPVWNAIQTALKEKRPYTLTYRLHTASGQEKWAWEQGQGIFSPAGELLYLEGFVTDVSDRKRAEAALQEREHFLQRVLDTEPGTVYIYDLAQRGNVFVNRHWLSSYGYTAEETRAMGESLFARIVHPDDLARIAAHHAAWRPAPEGETRGIEYRVRSKAGEWRWLHSRETAFARDPAGHVAQILGIAHDVTERKTAETALAERDALLNETGRIAKVGGWEFDPATGKGSWTDEVARIHDLDPSAETSAEIGLSFYHGEHRAAIERAVREAVESGKPYDLELELISAKGVRKWVRTIGHPRVEHGRVVRVSGSFQDITDRKQAEAALRENARQLETLSRRLLAAQESERRRVAHELHDEIGQLLTVVKLDLQTVLRQPGTAALAPALKEGMESIDRVVARVRDLSLDLRPSMLDDLGLVPALRWYVQRQTQRLGPEVKVTLTLPPALPRLPSETETACFRIAQEALTNVARHAGAQRIEVTLDARNRHIALSIHDDGRGFDTDAARRQTHGGGFGLLGMRERAELAGGRLTIDSSPGRGTTVRAHFPDVTAGAA